MCACNKCFAGVQLGAKASMLVLGECKGSGFRTVGFMALGFSQKFVSPTPRQSRY